MYVRTSLTREKVVISLTGNRIFFVQPCENYLLHVTILSKHGMYRSFTKIRKSLFNKDDKRWSQ